MPMPPAGTASPSRIARSMPPASMCWMTTGSVATSTYSSSGRSGCGRRPSARMTCWRVFDVVAVDEDLQGALRRRQSRRHRASVTGAMLPRPASRCRPVDRAAPSSGRAAGPRARPPSSTSAPTGRRCTPKNSSPIRSPMAQRIPPARCWSSSRVGQPRAHRAVRSGRVPVAADQRRLAHDRDAQERVERQRQRARSSIRNG